MQRPHGSAPALPDSDRASGFNVARLRRGHSSSKGRDGHRGHRDDEEHGQHEDEVTRRGLVLLLVEGVDGEQFAPHPGDHDGDKKEYQHPGGRIEDDFVDQAALLDQSAAPSIRPGAGETLVRHEDTNKQRDLNGEGDEEHRDKSRDDGVEVTVEARRHEGLWCGKVHGRQDLAPAPRRRALRVSGVARQRPGVARALPPRGGYLATHTTPVARLASCRAGRKVVGHGRDQVGWPGPFVRRSSRLGAQR